MPLRRRRLLTLLALAPLAATLLFLDLGRGSLQGDEALYATVAIESRAAERFVPLTVDGGPYVSKPIGGFLVLDASYRLLGTNELATRLPSALVGLLVVLLIGDAAARWFGGPSGVVAGVALASAFEVVEDHGFRTGNFEALLSLTVVAMGLGWVERRRGPGAAAWRLALAANALSAWVKYLAGPALAAAGALAGEAAFAARRDGARLRDGLLRVAQLLGAGAGAYLLHVALLRLAGVGDLWRNLVELDLVDRAAGRLWRQGSSPAFHLEGLADDYGWVLLLLLPFARGLARRFRDRSVAERELAPWIGAAAWTVGPLVALSAFGTRYPWYVVSALPGLALALGAGLVELRRLRVPAAGVALAAVAVLAVRLDAGLEVVRAPRSESPLRHLPAALDEMPEARFFLAPALHTRAVKESHIVRPQTAFYVRRLGARAEAGWPPADAGCAAVLFDRRVVNRPPEHLFDTPRYRFPPRLERGPDRYVVLDVCGGRIAERLGLEEPV